MMRLIPIVEGHGESRAVPALLNRWIGLQGMAGQFFTPDLAINAKGASNLKAPHDPAAHRGVEHFVGSALRGKADAILVVLDADGECLQRPASRKLGPELLDRARGVAGPVPVGVVVANREFEAWFLAELYGLDDAESRAGCKAAVGERIGEKYEPAVHQVQLSRRLEFTAEARARSRSYDKLARELERLTTEARVRREA